MSKLAKKLSRQIMAIALSVAMIMPNMAVYASEVSDPDSILPASEVETDYTSVETVETSDETAVEESIADDAQLSDTEDELPGDEDETITAGEEGTSGDADESDVLEAGDVTDDSDVQEPEAEKPLYDASAKDALPTSWNFRSGEGTLLDAENGVTIQGGDITDFNGLKIDATSAKAKFSVKRGDWAQINEGTIIKVPVAGLSKVNVVGYQGSKYTVDGNENTADADTFICGGKEETIGEDTGKWVTIEWSNNGYIGSINVEAITFDTTLAPASEAADKTDISFTAKKTEGSHAANDAINDINEIAVDSNIKYHNDHGIYTTAANAAMAVKIPANTKADIAVLGCQYGKSANMTAAVNSDGSVFKIFKTSSTEGYKAGAGEAYEYTVMGAEGTVTLLFDNNMYIHNLKVNYWAAGVTDKYAIKVKADDTLGSASADKPFAAAGEEVTLTATPEQGYAPVIKITDKAGAEISDVTVSEDNKFTMPDKDVIVEVTFTPTGTPHAIAVAKTVANGSVAAGSQTTAIANTVVKMEDVATATPAEGYELKEWQVTYKDAEGTTVNVEVTKAGKQYSFTMPDADITITPVFQAAVVRYFETTKFYEKFTEFGHAQNDLVGDDIDGFTVVSGAKYNDNQHGLSISDGAIMKLNLAPNKKYDLTVWACKYGASTSVKAAFNDKEVTLVKDDTGTVPENSNEAAPNYKLLNAEGEVTLTFEGKGYVHSIIVEESSGDAQYTVTVTDDGNGTAKADKALAPAETEITLTAEPDNHYRFKEWQVVSGGVTITDNKFTMPAANVEIKAVFEPIIRRDWDFVNDADLKGGKGAAVSGKTETVAGLSIDANESGSGWDSTGTGTDGAVAKNKTKITVPVEGICKVKVTAETANYTVDGKAAATAEETFDCEGTDSNVVIEMTADNHIKAINVTPVYYVKAGTYNFATRKDLKIDGFSFDKIEHKGNSHGCETTDTGASIVLNLSGNANITVLGCRYGTGMDVEMTATSGDVTKEQVSAESSDAVPEFSVKNADKGELTLTFENTETLWIHTVTVEYIPEKVPDVYSDGIDVWDFGAEQLESTDDVKYNNKLTEDIINSWYPNVDPGTSGVTIAAFEVKDEAGNVDFMFNDGGYSTTHRLRTSNTNITRYDEKTLKIGDTVYSGYIYSNKNTDKSVYIGVKLNAGDIMTAVVSSNGNDYTISVENPEGDIQNFARPSGPSIITYYATESGMHKIYNGTDEKLVVGRVTRQHSKSVTVSGKVKIPAWATDSLTLEFKCKESGMVKTVDVAREAGASEGSYEVVLFENYSYDVLVKPTTYVVETGAELQLGAANEEQTATHDIVVDSVPIRTLSGSIVGLDDDAMSKLSIEFKKPENKLYIPEITIDRVAKTYTADLESGTEYTIITTGINDYELDNTANNNSDRIRITAATIGRNITYTKKPVYNITIEPVGVTVSDLAAAEFKFTNINEEGYEYTFTGTEGIQLRDGTYTVVVSSDYKQKLTTNLVVDGADVTKTIAFDATPVTKWDFTDKANYDEANIVKNNNSGLSYTGDGTWKYHGADYGSQLSNVVISVPVSGSGEIVVTVGYNWDLSSGGEVYKEIAADGGKDKAVNIPYANGSNKVDITVGSEKASYIKTIEVKAASGDEYKETITVGKDKNYTTINDALAAVRSMNRTAEQHVTIEIDPGDYEEMLVIDMNNITLKNASNTPSIGLRNKGVDIDPNAVRITSYYGHGYTYYSMDSNCKWDAEVLAANKANGYPSFINPGSGTTSNSYWNATVSIKASNVSAEGIIFENSFNQYISKKAAEDIIVAQSGAKEGTVPRASMAAGDTKVQEKDYVERAAALAIYNDCAKISFDNCKFIGRQDTLYGGTGVTASFYDCSVYGGTDYIFGGMTAVFAKCDLVFNTNDQTKSGINNDVGYITAAQQKSGRGYLMYNCHVTSTIPGVDTTSQYTSKPGYLGRPWQSNTGEAVFYKTIVDEADANWQSPAGAKTSLIVPDGWNKSLGGESALSQEADTYEVAGVDNSSKRVSWAKVLTGGKLIDGKDITVATFLGEWNPFEGKDMNIVLPSDENIAAPAKPTAIITPEPTKEGEGEAAVEKVIKGASIVLSAETGAKVYYNVNPAADAVLNEESTPYTGTIKVEDSNIAADNTITIKAIAVKYGKTSEPLSVTYTVTEAPATQAPVLPEEGDIKLGSRIKISAQAGAEIYYNVNSSAAPDNTATLYTGKDGIEITTELVKQADSTVTIKAIAILNGKTSEVASATYGVIVNAPTANHKNGYQFPDGGGKVELTADEGVTILYTMGAEPADPTASDSEAKVYDEKGITVSADTTIKAVAKRGTRYSEVVTLNYIVPLSMPTANPESGSVLPVNARTVKLTADEGTTIYYTTGVDAAAAADPSKEDSGRVAYDSDNGITVTEETKAIKAVAVKGERYSVVAVFTYTLSDAEFEKVGALTAKVNGSSISDGATKTVKEGTDVTVTLTTQTEDAVIYYTLDGRTPIMGSAKYKDTGIVITAISETTVIKAVATKNNMLNSDVFTITINVRGSGSHGGDGDDSGLVISFVDDGEGTYEYTGAAIKPEIEVRNNGIPLVPGTDYTVKYSNNINVPAAGATKKPTVTVAGKGILSGSAVKEFTITKKAINDEEAVIAGRIVVAKDKKVPAPSVYYGSTKLKAGKDFTYDKNKTYSAVNDDETLLITGTGNFEGTLDVPVKVVADANAVKNAAKKFAVGIDKAKSSKQLIYTGESLEAAIEDCITVTAKDSSKANLKTNATANYILVLPKDTTNAGTVKFTVVGIGEYSGCNVTTSCKILPRTIANGDVKIDGDGVTAADGKVIVRGITDKATFASTGAIFPDMSLVYGADETDMKLGVDYKISYSSNKKVDVGKAKYTITFMGNFKGKYTSKAFNIDSAELDDDTAVVVIPDMVCNGKDGVYKAKPYVTIDNVTLKASEYKVTYYLDDEMSKEMDKNNKLKFGTETSKTVYVKIEPSAKSNYKNTDKDKTLTGSYTVWKKGSKEADLSKAKVTFYEGTATKATSKLSYTGNAIEPIKLDSSVKQEDGNCYIKVEVDKKTVPADAYEVEFVSNVNKGKATVVIKPADTSAQDGTTTAYTGGKVATFTIAPRKLANKDWFVIAAKNLGL